MPKYKKQEKSITVEKNVLIERNRKYIIILK
jgi:hypothetical protein